ncbi:MAG TPA: glycosyltransferase [Chthoniobacterales bacterium]
MNNPDRFSVLLVVEPGIDGVFRYVESLARFLIRQPQVELHFAYSSKRGSAPLDQLVGELQEQGAKVLDLRVSNSPGPADISALLRLWRFTKMVKPDVIHAHSSKAGVLARALAFAGVRARYFYTPNAYFQMYGPESPQRWLFHAIERVLGQVGATINVSASEAAFAREQLRLPQDRQVIVAQGVNGKRFCPARDSAEKRHLRARFDLPKDALLLGTVARFSRQKDPLTLYRALAIAMEKLPHLHFAHLGRGELVPEVEAFTQTWPASLRDRLHRHPSHKQPEEFYRVLDGLTLASLYEGFALAGLEAATTNLPVILSECPGNIDLNNRGLDRLYWVKPENPTELADAIVQWANDTATASCNHRQVALREFSDQALFNKMLDLYQSAPRQNT